MPPCRAEQILEKWYVLWMDITPFVFKVDQIRIGNRNTRFGVVIPPERMGNSSPRYPDVAVLVDRQQ